MPGLVVTTREGEEKLIDGETGLSVMEVIRAAGLDEILALIVGEGPTGGVRHER